MTSALSSWKSLKDNKTISPWLIQTFFRILPRIWASRFVPSKHWASTRPFPSILRTWAYSTMRDDEEQAEAGRKRWRGRCESRN